MKYVLTNISKVINGRTVFRIRAIKDFGNVTNGEQGGYVESYDNLSQDDTCWIYSNAAVYDKAQVFGNARVYSRACVFGNACIYGQAKVSGNSQVFGHAQVYGQTKVSDNAQVFGYAQVYGHAVARGSCRVHEYAQLSEKQVCKYGYISTDLSKNIVASIEAQTGLTSVNKEVYCYKYVDEEQLPMFEPSTEVTHSCMSVYNAQVRSDGDYSKYRLFCKVKLSDIIAIQDEKIICTKLVVLGICDDIFSLI